MSEPGEAREPKRTLPEQWSCDEVMDCLAGFEEIGDWQGAASLLATESATLEAAGPPPGLPALRERLEAALLHEDVHGEGALLKRDHPVYIRDKEEAARHLADPAWAVHIRDLAALFAPVPRVRERPAS